MKLEVIGAYEDYLHIALVGKMDLAGAAAMEKEFLAAIGDGTRSVIADFSGVTFIGSMGLRVLLMAIRDLKTANKKLIVLNPQRLVAEIFDASGILDVLSVSTDLDQAVALAKS